MLPSSGVVGKGVPQTYNFENTYLLWECEKFCLLLIDLTPKFKSQQKVEAYILKIHSDLVP